MLKNIFIIITILLTSPIWCKADILSTSKMDSGTVIISEVTEIDQSVPTSSTVYLATTADVSNSASATDEKTIFKMDASYSHDRFIPKFSFVVACSLWINVTAVAASANVDVKDGRRTLGGGDAGRYDWNNYAYTDGIADDVWGTAGAANTSSDIYSTGLAASSFSISTTGAKWISLDTTWINRWIRTTNQVFFLLMEVTSGNTNGFTMSSNDDGTAANRPRILYYFRSWTPINNKSNHIQRRGVISNKRGRARQGTHQND